ncbi:MAG TPA: hypothetical protein ENK85_03740 [Saprospiraceae bacterium]|nr:hypothetical protein [Saprospiraceae bacterium]
MDNLKQFISDHRSEFDDRRPPEGMWMRIESKLPRSAAPKIRFLNRQLIAAATVLLLVGVAFVAGQLSAKKASVHDIYPEFAETESYFQRKIDSKKRAVAVHATDSTWVDDIHQLEMVMNELRAELVRNPEASKGDIIQAMIDNYNIRLEIMDRILEKTNDKTYLNTKPSNDDNPE